MRYEWSGGGRSSSLHRMTGCFPISNPAAQMSDICQSQRLGRVRRQRGAPAACTIEQEVLARGENRVCDMAASDPTRIQGCHARREANPVSCLREPVPYHLVDRQTPYSRHREAGQHERARGDYKAGSSAAQWEVAQSPWDERGVVEELLAADESSRSEHLRCTSEAIVLRTLAFGRSVCAEVANVLFEAFTLRAC
jgi:hypothetical protein